MNPHLRETHYTHYLEEKTYNQPEWYDTGIWVEAGGFTLIIGTINIAIGYSANVGFRLVDENNNPLPPYRTSTNDRLPAHFSMEPEENYSWEDFTPVSFHMIANCKYVKLQIRPDDRLGSSYIGFVRLNYTDAADKPYHHKPICTMSAIPLLPSYQGGANTIFNYPQPRMPRSSNDDKPLVYHSDKPKPSSSSKVPRR